MCKDVLWHIRHYMFTHLSLNTFIYIYIYTRLVAVTGGFLSIHMSEHGRALSSAIFSSFQTWRYFQSHDKQFDNDFNGVHFLALHRILVLRSSKTRRTAGRTESRLDGLGKAVHPWVQSAVECAFFALDVDTIFDHVLALVWEICQVNFVILPSSNLMYTYYYLELIWTGKF